MIEGDELQAYLKSLAEYNEIKDITNTAFQDGKIKGEFEAQIEIAKTMLKKSFEISLISEITTLSVKKIESLK